MALTEIQKKERSEYLEKNLKITECSQNKKYVFISYASDNWETVFKDAVVPLQKEYGMRVYADKAFDKENDKWIIPMLRNIRGAEAMVAFVSQSYIESYACFLELLTAVNNNVPVVFVSLNDDLKLGDTTDQPEIERGVKKEMIRQGDNLATKTNNTSNDIMRAMKSAYTSLSTLLEQDALAKYDISDAFINFFRDAAVNKKTINDLKALKRSVNSVSKEVFDAAAVGKSQSAAHTAVSAASAPADPAASATSATSAASAKSPAPAQGAPSAPAKKTEPKAGNKQKNIFGNRKKRNIIIAAAALVVIVAAVIIFVLNAGSSSSGMDAIKIDGASISMTYTGNSKKGKPNGEGSCTFGENALGYLEFEGSWENGGLKSGKLTKTRKDQNGRPIGTRVFSGVFVNNMPNGQGSETGYDENGNIGYIFEGEFKDSKYNGQGKLTDYYENGNVRSTYEGEFEDDKYSGKGKLTNYDENGNIKTTFEGKFKDGRFVRDYEVVDVKIQDFIYTGEWSNGAPNGYGTAVFENGYVYEGYWKDGASNGYGTETGYDENGKVTNIYEGDWKDGYPHGHGTQTSYHTNGRDVYIYEGEFKNGERNGYGTETGYDENGKVMGIYEGEWKNYKRDGYGIETSYDENGTITWRREGEFKNDMANGRGTETGYYENGIIEWSYVGEYKDGNRNGYFTETHHDENGRINWTFEGDWKDNKRNGQGTDTDYDENGKVTYVFKGEWKEGKRDGSGVATWYDENGNVTDTANEVWQDGRQVS